MTPLSIPPALVDCLRAAPAVAVLTGAGISRESGIPTFRDPLTGLWAQYRAEDLCSVEAFARDPRLVWRWHEWLRQQMAAAEPNAAHRAVAALARRVGHFTLITQNIDSLHQRAGSAAPLELHGNIHRYRCAQEGTPVELPPGARTDLPYCQRCGAPLRHAVVWFGEQLPADVLAEAYAATNRCTVFFSIGTSGAVQPAASLAYMALQRGATVVEINPQPTPLTDQAAYSLRGPAGQVLPALLAAVWPASS